MSFMTKPPLIDSAVGGPLLSYHWRFLFPISFPFPQYNWGFFVLKANQNAMGFYKAMGGTIIQQDCGHAEKLHDGVWFEFAV